MPESNRITHLFLSDTPCSWRQIKIGVSEDGGDADVDTLAETAEKPEIEVGPRDTPYWNFILVLLLRTAIFSLEIKTKYIFEGQACSRIRKAIQNDTGPFGPNKLLSKICNKKSLNPTLYNSERGGTFIRAMADVRVHKRQDDRWIPATTLDAQTILKNIEDMLSENDRASIHCESFTAFRAAMSGRMEMATGPVEVVEGLDNIYHAMIQACKETEETDEIWLSNFSILGYLDETNKFHHDLYSLARDRGISLRRLVTINTFRKLRKVFLEINKQSRELKLDIMTRCLDVGDLYQGQRLTQIPDNDAMRIRPTYPLPPNLQIFGKHTAFILAPDVGYFLAYPTKASAIKITDPKTVVLLRKNYDANWQRKQSVLIGQSGTGVEPELMEIGDKLFGKREDYKEWRSEASEEEA